MMTSCVSALLQTYGLMDILTRQNKQLILTKRSMHKIVHKLVSHAESRGEEDGGEEGGRIMIRVYSMTWIPESRH